MEEGEIKRSKKKNFRFRDKEAEIEIQKRDRESGWRKEGGKFCFAQG